VSAIPGSLLSGPLDGMGVMLCPLSTNTAHAPGIHRLLGWWTGGVSNNGGGYAATDTSIVWLYRARYGAAPAASRVAERSLRDDPGPSLTPEPLRPLAAISAGRPGPAPTVARRGQPMSTQPRVQHAQSRCPQRAGGWGPAHM